MPFNIEKYQVPQVGKKKYLYVQNVWRETQTVQYFKDETHALIKTLIL